MPNGPILGRRPEVARGPEGRNPRWRQTRKSNGDLAHGCQVRNTVDMGDLLETLAQELERPRDVTMQVVRHLAANYGITDDEVGAFLDGTLPTLEEDEVDLVLSPLFTPRIDDQAVFASRLGQDSLSSEERNDLVARAVSRPTNASFVTSDGETHAYRLGEVTVERYVHRLRLEGTIPDPIFELIQRFPAPHRAMLQAVARASIWDSDERYSILETYLKATTSLDTVNADDDRFLLDIVERYKPTDIADLVAKIPGWREELRGDLEAGGRPFFSEGVQREHGGQHDQRAAGGTLIEGKRHDLDFLGRLEPLLVG